jgi:cytochrome c oxidase subunit 2
VTLGVLLGVSFHTGDAVAAASTEATTTVQVIGKQWWWQFQILNDEPDKIVITANELHLPVGEPVRFDLETRDVIHSFWIPELTGKRDLIPGQISSLIATPKRTGTFKGRCAEFCGLQHAHMELVVVVEERPQFEAWLAAQSSPPPAPEGEEAIRGREVFLSHACPACHNISGTAAFGSNGPTLSHLASRTTIAAGTLPNNRGNLTGWIADPQASKPGARMPPQPMPADELNALVTYLETLR